MLLAGSVLCHAGKFHLPENSTPADTTKPTLLWLVNNLKGAVAVATGKASVTNGTDRGKLLRENLFSIAKSALHLLEKDIPKPTDEPERILYEMCEACAYGLLSFCYESNYIPKDDIYNYGRAIAIYKPLTEHTVAYWSHEQWKLKAAYNIGDLNSMGNSTESYAQIMNQMLHREMMNANYREGFLLGNDSIRQNVWNYMRIYLKLDKLQNAFENRGAHADFFGGKIWNIEEYYYIPEWSVWLCQKATAEDKQLLWETYMSVFDDLYYSRKNGFNLTRESHFGKGGFYLTEYYLQRVPMAEKKQDASWKEKYDKKSHHGLNIIPELLSDYFDPGWPPDPLLQNEVKRLTQKYLVQYTDEAFAVRMRRKDHQSLYHIVMFDLREVNFIFNVLKINLPDEEKYYCDHLIELLRHRAGENILGEDLRSAAEKKRNEEAAYFTSIIAFLKKYATRYNNSSLLQKLDSITAAMEKDPYTAGPALFFQDEPILNLVKNL